MKVKDSTIQVKIEKEKHQAILEWCEKNDTTVSIQVRKKLNELYEEYLKVKKE